MAISNTNLDAFFLVLNLKLITGHIYIICKIKCIEQHSGVSICLLTVVRYKLEGMWPCLLTNERSNNVKTGGFQADNSLNAIRFIQLKYDWSDELDYQTQNECDVTI